LGNSDCFEACYGGLKKAILFEGSTIWRIPSCIARASIKTGAPKLSAALIFLWLLSFYQEKESNIDLVEQKNRAEQSAQINTLLTFASSAKPNEHIFF